MQVCLQNDSGEREEVANNSEAKPERKTAILFALQATSLSATPLLNPALPMKELNGRRFRGQNGT